MASTLEALDDAIGVGDLTGGRCTQSAAHVRVQTRAVQYGSTYCAGIKMVMSR